MNTHTTTYTNRQGNQVEIVTRQDGTVQSVEVSGTGSNRAFQAQLRAAKRRKPAYYEVSHLSGSGGNVITQIVDLPRAWKFCDEMGKLGAQPGFPKPVYK